MNAITEATGGAVSYSLAQTLLAAGFHPDEIVEGYFLCGDLETLLPLLQQQRRRQLEVSERLRCGLA